MSIEARAEVALTEWAKLSEAGALFSAEVKAAPVDKRKATMASEHGDMAETFLGDLGLGFQGDFSDGEGELVAVVSYRHNVGKVRGKRSGKRRHKRSI